MGISQALLHMYNIFAVFSMPINIYHDSITWNPHYLPTHPAEDKNISDKKMAAPVVISQQTPALPYSQLGCKAIILFLIHL